MQGLKCSSCSKAYEFFSLFRSTCFQKGDSYGTGRHFVLVLHPRPVLSGVIRAESKHQPNLFLLIKKKKTPLERHAFSNTNQIIREIQHKGFCQKERQKRGHASLCPFTHHSLSLSHFLCVFFKLFILQKISLIELILWFKVIAPQAYGSQPPDAAEQRLNQDTREEKHSSLHRICF